MIAQYIALGIVSILALCLLVVIIRERRSKLELQGAVEIHPALWFYCDRCGRECHIRTTWLSGHSERCIVAPRCVVCPTCSYAMGVVNSGMTWDSGADDGPDAIDYADGPTPTGYVDDDDSEDAYAESE